jgi:predicted mannosyl-3-phosphoglycerate phosphatase (HAD superfamily)
LVSIITGVKIPVTLDLWGRVPVTTIEVLLMKGVSVIVLLSKLIAEEVGVKTMVEVQGSVTVTTDPDTVVM